MDSKLEDFIDRLYRIGAIKVDTERGFRLNSHRFNEDEPLSPIYIELGSKKRQLDPGPLEDSDIAEIAELCWLLLRPLRKVDFSAVAGVPNGGTSIAYQFMVRAYDDGKDLVYFELNKLSREGYAYVGPIIKGNDIPEGTSALLIEDNTSTGRRLEETAERLRPRYHVTDAVAFVNRAQGAKENLKKIGVTLHHVTTLSHIAAVGRRRGHITKEQHVAICTYLANDAARRRARAQSTAA